MPTRMSQPPRVLLDTNVLITFLLDRERKSPATPIVEAALVGEYHVLISDELVHELATRVERKPYLAQRIASANVAALTRGLFAIGERIDLSAVTIYRVVRDPEDDYLIALAVAGNADILVTGARDLLAIADLTPFRILTLRTFAELFDNQ